MAGSTKANEAQMPSRTEAEIALLKSTLAEKLQLYIEENASVEDVEDVEDSEQKNPEVKAVLLNIRVRQTAEMKKK